MKRDINFFNFDGCFSGGLVVYSFVSTLFLYENLVDCQAGHD